MHTIKEIAEMANVSRSTVSRALNNSGYVSEEARKRINQVIEKTGYVPSEHAKSLRTKKTKVIGVIVPTIHTETSGKIVAGIDHELAKHGYQILLATTNLNRKKELEYLDLLQVRQVDGIILLGTNTQQQLVEKLNTLSVPVVVIGQELEGIISVVNDDEGAAMELTSYLISQGHTRIGFIGVDETDRAVGYMRKQGYLKAMNHHRLPVKSEWMQEAVFDIDSGHDAMQRILQQPNHPSAVFAATDRLAVGAISFLKRADFRIPTDIAVAGIGASEIATYIDPPLTTVEYQYELAGEHAARQILSQASGSTEVHEKIVLDYRLSIRDSV
ncbi:LacI family transcriptional regulator [Lentibacillus cibarius]|uniref:LacI family transcriptional regulator n=1 Tax=Lentibacillus cibarius TaxID=2583219 RepID=A0A549YEX8_9BACI|nr:LacI family DNA-binding transcriptional regulator [Lentibacillus cibarius]TMN21536.1 LacI family transcriptional regulator [Lentibacillus cibarius]TRM10436.1 LacI family transcriptional regulator [Lentibacillus cibarius]